MHSNRRYTKASKRIAKREHIRQIITRVLQATLVVSVLVCFAILLKGSFLQVKTFEVSGGQSIGQENVKTAAQNFIRGNSFYFVPKSNILFLSKDKLAAALLSQFNRLQKVDVNKNFFKGGITLSLTEREAQFLWCDGNDECYLMAGSGLVFEKVDHNLPGFSASSSDKVIFRGNIAGDPLMKNFAAPEQMQNFIKLIESFKSAGFGLIAVSVESADKAIAQTSAGDIIFDPDEKDLSAIAQNAALLINETRSKNPSASFDYIDTRFGNKLFYKLK